MNDDLIKIKAKLGLVDAVWLHKKDGNKIISVKNKSRYGEWAYLNAVAGLGSIRLNPNGTCAGINATIFPSWSPYTLSRNNGSNESPI